MFHNISEPILKRMRYLEKIDQKDRIDGTSRMKRLRQIPPETGKFIKDSTHINIQFDPESGIQLIASPQKTSAPTVIYDTILTNEEIIMRAHNDANNSFNSFIWAGLGGPSTLMASTILANISTGIISEFDISDILFFV